MNDAPTILQLGHPGLREVSAPVTFPVDAAPDTDFRRYYDLSAGAVIARLREGLPELSAVHLLTDRDVVIWLDLEHGILRLSFDRLRLSASNPHQLLVMIVVLGALMLGIAWVFLRNQLGPINRLADHDLDAKSPSSYRRCQNPTKCCRVTGIRRT